MAEEPILYIVDDDAGIRTSMCLVLKANGWPTRSFGSAEAFLDGYRPGTPGCLLLDLDLPGMSGAELLETLAARGTRLPTILITAYVDDPLVRRAEAAGTLAVLAKPFREAALLPILEQALNPRSP